MEEKEHWSVLTSGLSVEDLETIDIDFVKTYLGHLALSICNR